MSMEYAIQKSMIHNIFDYNIYYLKYLDYTF